MAVFFTSSVRGFHRRHRCRSFEVLWWCNRLPPVLRSCRMRQQLLCVQQVQVLVQVLVQEQEQELVQEQGVAPLLGLELGPVQVAPQRRVPVPAVDPAADRRGPVERLAAQTP